MYIYRACIRVCLEAYMYIIGHICIVFKDIYICVNFVAFVI